MMLLKLVGAFGLFTSIAVCQGQTTLVVQGVGGKTVTLSAADLSTLPQQTVKTTDHGTPATFDGFLLTDVFAQGGSAFGGEVSPHGSLVLPGRGSQGRLPGSVRLGVTGFDIYGQIRVRGDEAGWQAALGQGRSISVGSAG